MKRLEYKKGDIINDLIFIKDCGYLVSPSRKTRKAVFLCKCGNFFETTIQSVISKNTKSCGCFGKISRSERFKKHGLRNDPIYKIWCGIKTRCYNKNRVDYKYYGALGIRLSEEFLNFKLFYDYVTSLPLYEERESQKLTIDRIDVCKNYEKNNLRWATKKQQSLNQRRNSKS